MRESSIQTNKFIGQPIIPQGAKMMVTAKKGFTFF